jgi:hypothetical protein
MDGEPIPLHALRRAFRPDQGYEVDHANWVKIMDGEVRLIPVATVRGRNVDLTFFPKIRKNALRD